MIKVTLPEGFLQERVYAIHVLCYEFLGLSYTIQIARDSDVYCIEFEGKQIRIQDHFFSRYTSTRTYLQSEALPEAVYSANQSGLDGIMRIYGEDQFAETENTIACGVDVFASTFFMLSRWEEYVNTIRDQHGRFPAEASLAEREGFLHRPVVNEYAALLKKWLVQMGVREQMFKKRSYHLSLHCDVDTARYWTSPFSIMNKILFQLLKQGSISGAWNEIRQFASFRKSGRDPYDTFDTLMDLAESKGGKACFYFLVGKEHTLDGRQILNDPHVKVIFDHILERGHQTGIHFSYLTADHESLMTVESTRYQTTAHLQPQSARQHYLRCVVPNTWSAWERAGVTSDSTMGYPESPGFRCGTCYPFPLFDVRARRMLHVFERPLIAMDVTFRFYEGCTPDDVVARVQPLINTVRKYDGEFVLLWHNSSFSGEWKGWEDVLERVLAEE